MKKAILMVLLVLLLYILVGAVAPFVLQPAVREDTVKRVEEMSFLAEEEAGERVCVLADNGEALKERIRLISQAKERIILSTFDFRADESGKDVLAALQAAAQRGVNVQVLVDGFSGFSSMTGNPWFRALSGMERVQIKLYSPVNPAVPWKLMGRLHDKYLIADDTAYILGGRNTYEYFLGDHDRYKNYDWDVLVYRETLRQDSSLEQVKAYFEAVWALPDCRLYHDGEEELEKKKVQQAGAELAERYTAMQKTHPDWFEPCDYAERTVPVNRITFVSNPTHCYAKEPVVFYTLTELMRQAEQEVKFHTPYILCNRWMLQRLKEVCGSVPAVSMMTNSVANNGNPFGAMDYARNKKKILDTGVQILEYDGGVSYHGKCFVMDDRISGIGSFNWDMRSVYLDTETMLVIDSKALNAALRKEMEHYEAQALTVIDKDEWIVPEGMEKQEITVKKWFRILALGSLFYWARFLM